MIELNQVREALVEKTQAYKDKVKSIFDKRANQKNFQVDDLVLRWDVRRQDRGKHDKFDNLWFGPFKVFAILDNNTFLLENLKTIIQSEGLLMAVFLSTFLSISQNQSLHCKYRCVLVK